MLKFRNPLLRIKFAYGYETMGETGEAGGTSGQDNDINDLGRADEQHQTPTNPANVTIDAEAETDFPQLVQKKEERVIWPPRTD